MCKHTDIHKLYNVSVFNFDGDEVVTMTMIADDISDIITYLKDNYSAQGFYYEISNLRVAELPIASDLI